MLTEQSNRTNSQMKLILIRENRIINATIIKTGLEYKLLKLPQLSLHSLEINRISEHMSEGILMPSRANQDHDSISARCDARFALAFNRQPIARFASARRLYGRVRVALKCRFLLAIAAN